MSEAEYRIEYRIERKKAGEDDFEEIGFYSSGASSDLSEAAHMVASQVQNGEWETEAGQPEPGDVMDEQRAAREGK